MTKIFVTNVLASVFLWGAAISAVVFVLTALFAGWPWALLSISLAAAVVGVVFLITTAVLMGQKAKKTTKSFDSIWR